MSGLGRAAFAMLTAIASTACSPGTGGDLRPVAAEGVKIVDKTAMIDTPPLSAQVTALWSSMRGQSMFIRYTNNGTRSARIVVTDLRMTHSSGEAMLTAALDTTAVDKTDKRSDNDDPQVLFEIVDRPGKPATLVVPAGTTRVVFAVLSDFAESTASTIKAGDRVLALVPMAGHNVQVAFKTESPPFF